MNQPSVTGCIVTHNNKKTIREAVGTVLANTDPQAFRLYVVDNASTDGTPEIIRTEFPQVCLIEMNENKGFGAGHNVVLPMLQSKYHFIINPDILLRDDAIGVMCAFMEQNPDVGMVSPNILFPDGRQQVLGKRDPKLKYLLASRFAKDRENDPRMREYAMQDQDLTVPQDIACASGCFVGIRTDIFRELGGFDERYFMYFEDFDLSREVRKHTRVVYDPEAVVYHRWERASKSNKKLLMIHIMSMLKYFWKWKSI